MFEGNQVVNDELSKGNVPSRLRHSVLRINLMAHLAEKLKQCAEFEEKLQNWIVICGLPGTGKSHLVADTLRYYPEFTCQHFNRIIWVNDNTTIEGDLHKVFADLYITMISDDFAKLMNSNFMDDVQKLRHVILDELKICSKTLIIFDNVYLQKVPDLCQIFPCPIIFTTSIRDIFEQRYFSINTISLDHNSLFLDYEVRALADTYGFKLTDDEVRALMFNGANNIALIDKMLLCSLKQKTSSFFTKLKRPLSNFKYPSAYSFRSVSDALSLLLEDIEPSIVHAFQCCSTCPPETWFHGGLLQSMWPIETCGHESENEIAAAIAGDVDELCNKMLVETDVEIAEYYFLPLFVHTYLVNRDLKSDFTKLKTKVLEMKTKLTSKYYNNGVVLSNTKPPVLWNDNVDLYEIWLSILDDIESDCKLINQLQVSSNKKEPLLKMCYNYLRAIFASWW